MDCKDCRCLISSLIDEELAEDQAALIRAHLRECPACNTCYETETSLKAIVRECAERTPVPADLLPRLLSQASSGRAGASLFEKFLRIFEARPVPQLTAAVAFLAILAIPFYSSYKDSHLLAVNCPKGVIEHLQHCPACAQKAVALAERHMAQLYAYDSDGKVQVAVAELEPLEVPTPGVSTARISSHAVMIVGTSDTSPAGVTLYLARQNGTNIVFWEEGNRFRCICSRDPLPKVERAAQSFLLAANQD